MTTKNWLDFGARRIWAVLFAAIVVGVVAGGYGFYRVSGARIRLDKYNELAAIGELKAGQIVQWRQERLDDAIKNAESPLFRKAVAAWLKDSGNPALRGEFVERLKLEQRVKGYTDALLLDPDGRILLAAKDDPGPVDDATMKALAQAIEGKQAVLSELFRSPDGNVYLDAVAPVSDAGNQPIAIAILRSDANKYLYPAIESWPIPSQSAETLLVRKAGDDVLFLNELRHQAGTALSLRIPLTRSDVPAVQAVQGKQDLFEGKDYRGIEVLADLGPVPGSPWFIVAKVDASEILAEVNYRARASAAFVVLFALLIAAMMAFLYRQRQVRIYRVLYASEQDKHKAQELLRATLISIGDGVISTDERGCITFINPVAQTLTGWPHAEAQGKPLAEVFHIINAQTLERCENPAEKVLATGAVVDLANHTMLIARDGTERQIADSGAPVRDTEGNVIGVVLVFRDVTEQYHMQDVLASSEVRYRRLFESAKDGILILDAETGIVVDVNPFLAELLNFPREQFLGKALWELGFFRDVAASQANFLELQRKEYVRYEDLPLETADGHRIEVEFVSNVYLVDHMKVIQCNIRDIGERKRAEAEAKSARDYIANIINAIGDPVFVKDEQHRFALANDPHCALAGCSHDELIGKTDVAFFPSEQVEVFWEMDRQVLSTGQENVNEESVTDARTGETRTMITRKTRYVDPNGNRFVVGVIRDITERKRAEEALHHEKEFARMVLDNIADGVVACNAEGKLTLFNRTSREWHGVDVLALAPEEWSKYYDIYGPDGITPLATESIPLVRAFRGETLRDAGMVINAKDQPGRNLLASGGPFFDAHHNLLGAVVVMHDITERKRAEEERAKLEAQLRQSQKLESVGRLAGGVAHEINNPITGIMNYAQLIKDRLGDRDETVNEYAGEIIHGSERIATIVRNLLAFARHEKQSHSPARINDIVDEVLSLIRTVIRHDQIEIDVDVAEDLPLVNCRSQQIQQVIMNLMTNARDALNERYPGHDPGKTMAITARVVENEGASACAAWLRISVEDHGAGIAPEVREHLFDFFFTTKTRNIGTGLGLSISHGIVTEHGGRISVESEPDAYTRVHVDLPLNPADNTDDAGEDCAP